jgi:dihydroxy-acid dehydratase
VGPEAAVGGPIGLIRNGDIININARTGELNVELSENELIERRKSWQAKKTDYNSGTIWKFAQLVGPAYKGAVTHPGAKAETHIYADI